MPYKDKQQRTKVTRESHKRMYAADYRLMIRHDSGMAEPIEKAAKEKGMKPTDFIKSVLKEYLISHRYMTDAPNSEE